jgi:hypothetical protein
MRGWLRGHGLTLTMLGLFLVFLVAQGATGFRSYNRDQQEHGESTVGFGAYLKTGHFVEATFENWESEYLQMGLYVLLTAFLYQRGSSESKDPDTPEPVDEDPRERAGDPNAPWAVRQGGIVPKVYAHSLTLALLVMFLVSWALHAWGGAREYSQQQLAHGGTAVSTVGFLGDPSSGFNRSRTGRANSWRSPRWRGCRSSCGSGGRRSRSRWRRRTARREANALRVGSRLGRWVRRGRREAASREQGHGAPGEAGRCPRRLATTWGLSRT